MVIIFDTNGQQPPDLNVDEEPFTSRVVVLLNAV